MSIGAVVTALVLGFLAGLFAFRVKNRWCPMCGNDTEELTVQAHHRAAQPR